MSGVLHGVVASLKAAAAAATDSFFKYVTLLLHGDGTNGAQNNTFLDGSTNAFSITRNGNTTQGSFSPFSQTGWSNYFDGTGDYLSVADNVALRMESGDFTIEFWWSPSSIAGFQTVLEKGYTAAGGLLLQTGSGNGTIVVYAAGVAVITASSGSSVGAWDHYALVRSGTTLTLYRNGASVGSATNSTNFNSTASFFVGGSTGGGGYYVNGYLSNVRIVKGTAVYTANFTPPTAPLTNITNTSLLTCQSNRFIDNSSNAFAITRNGDVRVEAFSPFNPSTTYSTSVVGGSGYFDGTGDYLSVADSTALDLNSTYTTELWFYQPAAGNGCFFGRGGGASSWSNTNGHEYLIFIESGTFYYQFNNGSGSTPATISATAPVAGTWHHVAVGYNGTTTRVWLDGASIGTSTSAYSLPTTRNLTYVGLNPAGASPFTGYISNLRVVKGTDVYGVGNTSITVPTSPLTSITNTSLLLNFTNGGVFDNASQTVLETVGNAQVSTTQKKFGTGSMYFDGTGDWLIAPDRPPLRFGTGAFTIECWLYLGATGAARGIIAKGTSTTGWLLSTDASNKVVFTYATSTITSTAALSGSTWYHIAVVREGTGSNQTKIYIDGTNDGTGTVSTDFNQTSVMYIGANRTGGDAMNGYIDDLRITNGYARYTANFTPPTAAFPDN